MAGQTRLARSASPDQRRSATINYARLRDDVLGCGLDRVDRSERPKFGVLDLPMHADLISSDGIHVVARSL